MRFTCISIFIAMKQEWHMERNQIRINENELRQIVKKTINEYLDKLTANAMRSLGTVDKPSELATQTHRYLRKDPFNPKQGEAKIQKNEWLIHITSQDVGMKIMREGFKTNVTDLNFRATQDFEGTKEMTGKGLCFACELQDSNTWLSIIDQAKDYGEEDWCGVIFQANGFNAFTGFGDKNEVVFRADSAHNFMLMVPMTREESEQYIQHNKNRFDFLRYRDFEGVKVIDRNGRTLIKGDMEELFHTNIPFQQRISGNRVTPQQKMKTWLDNNAVQYRKHFGNKEK